MTTLKIIFEFIKTKKFIILPVLVVLLLAGGYFLFFQNSDVVVDRGGADLAAMDPNLDSDNDQLKDWEEKVYGTDPQNSDTDGDGFKDGSELKSGYDPLVKGDGNGSDKIQEVKTVGSENRSVSVSENITASMFAGLMNKKTSELTEEDLGEEKILSNMESVYSDPVAIDKAAISAFTQTTESSAKAMESFINPPLPGVVEENPEDTQEIRQEYLKIFSETLKKNLPQNPRNILAQAIDYFKTKDATEITASENAYKTTIEELLKIKPPRSFYDFHVKELKSLQSTYILAETIKNYEEDRLKTAAYLSFASILYRLSEALTKDFNSLLDAYKLTI